MLGRWDYILCGPRNTSMVINYSAALYMASFNHSTFPCMCRMTNQEILGASSFLWLVAAINRAISCFLNFLQIYKLWSQEAYKGCHLCTRIILRDNHPCFYSLSGNNKQEDNCFSYFKYFILRTCGTL